LRKACAIDGIPNECLRHFQEDHWYVTNIYLIIAFDFHIFQVLRRFAEVTTILKPGKDSRFPQNLCPISFLSTIDKHFEKGIY
jgi:hypothetical protein